MEPAYLRLLEEGTLEERVDQALDLLAPCRVCPRNCQVDRLSGERGYCGGGRLPRVSSYSPHYGEEPPLVGRMGSGTIFFAGCSMACTFCQNYSISQVRQGKEVAPEGLAGMMLDLQARGCHNINFVSPSHFVPQILEAVLLAARDGLKIPLVYNTGTYDSVETLRLLDGIFDIFMPDAKYGSDEVARDLSDAPGYTGIMQAAILEMQRQAGDLVVDGGVAVRGLIIRHLVLPGDLAGSGPVMEFIGGKVSKDAYVNVMSQYRPCWRVSELGDKPRYAVLGRHITTKEYWDAVAFARKAGIHRGIPFEEPG
jgi:putative pyruvate formate lyase activating enzyme